jgi:hypothetical protein
MPLRLRSAGGGSVLLKPPVAQAADVSMEVPAYDGAKLLTDKTPGVVLQVVQGVYTGATTVASASYVALPVLATITPVSASSKILVRTVIHCGVTGTNEGLHGRLYRNGAVVPVYGNAAGSRDQAWFHCGAHYSAYEQYAATAEYLDSPNSIAAMTYQIWVRGNSAPYPVLINTCENDADSSATSRTVSTITLMEIAG